MHVVDDMAVHVDAMFTAKPTRFLTGNASHVTDSPLLFDFGIGFDLPTQAYHELLFSFFVNAFLTLFQGEYVGLHFWGEEVPITVTHPKIENVGLH